MTNEEIDRVIAEWEERLRLVDDNLLALESEPTYQMLVPRAARRAPLEGESKRVVGPALDALNDVFEHRGRLTELIERAKEIRASMSGLLVWNSQEKTQELMDLLWGRSVELPRIAMPLAQRALLGPGEHDVRLRPGELLEAMAAAFGRARDAVVAVERAWARLEPSLLALEKRLEVVSQSAKTLGVEATVRDEIEALGSEVDALRVRVALDPLGTAGDLDARLTPRIEAMSVHIDALAALRGRVEEALVHARESHKELKALHVSAKRAVVGLPLEIEGARAAGTPVDDGLLEGLGPWLDKIEQTAHNGRWSSAEVGLSRWRETAAGYRSTDAAIADAMQAVLARRDELAGRLVARRAQHAAMASRGVHLDPRGEEAAREAERLVKSRPTPLASVTQLVDEFERALRSAK